MPKSPPKDSSPEKVSPPNKDQKREKKKSYRIAKAGSLLDGLASEQTSGESLGIDLLITDEGSSNEANSQQNSFKYKTYGGKQQLKFRIHSSLDSLFDQLNEGAIYNHYTKILPLAKRQMETRLCELADRYNSEFLRKLDKSPCEKFAAGQIVKISRSLCLKSLAGDSGLNRQYLLDTTTRIEELLQETAQRCPEKIDLLAELARKFALITSQTLRILTCIENNPADFDFSAEAAELKNTEQDLQSYILQSLGQVATADRSEARRPTLVISRGQRLVSISVKQNNDNSGSGDDISKAVKPDASLPRESDFSIIKLISQGAFSAVFLVRYLSTQRRFAMKKIHKNHALLKNQVRQIFAERDILSFTDNPFVISMFCSFETMNSYCMVMEYAEGGDCASLLKSVVILPTELARTYIAETLVAVEYIHNYGIIHRDIKPDNLLITSMGHIKLSDFGLSKIGLMNVTTLNSKDFPDSFHDKNIQGTPSYIAPEVVLNKPYGRAVDYWSVGIVLYEFLVGCTPFYGETVDDLFEAIVDAPLEWPQDEEAITPEAQDIIMKLLDRDPQTRAGSDNTEPVRSHLFFDEIQWNDLLHTKAQLLPRSANEEDTSMFDDRSDRYEHYMLFRTDSNSDSLLDSSFDSYTKLFQEVSASNTLNVETNVSVSEISHTPPSLSQKSAPQTSTLEKALQTNRISVTTFELEKTSISGQFGFNFVTARVFCTKNLSFLIHIVVLVRPGSCAAVTGLMKNLVILFINNVSVVGRQHVDIVRQLLGLKSLKMVVANPHDLGISVHKRNAMLYNLTTDSLFFKQLVRQNTVFEKKSGLQYIPVSVDPEGQVARTLTSHSNEHPHYKRTKPNIFKTLIRRFIEQRTANLVLTSTPKLLSHLNKVQSIKKKMSFTTKKEPLNSKKLSLDGAPKISSPLPRAKSGQAMSSPTHASTFNYEKKSLNYRNLFNEILKDVKKLRKG